MKAFQKLAGLKDLIFVSRLRQSVQGRATMAKTIQCAEGLEKVFPFKYGHLLGLSMLNFSCAMM